MAWLKACFLLHREKSDSSNQRKKEEVNIFKYQLRATLSFLGHVFEESFLPAETLRHDKAMIASEPKLWQKLSHETFKTSMEMARNTK